MERGAARIEIVRHGLRPLHLDVVGEVRVDPEHPLPLGASRAGLEVHDLLQSMNAGVRPARAVHDGPLVRDARDGIGEHGLNAALPALLLPAEKFAAVVLDPERDFRHRRKGGAGRAPRSAPYPASASIRPCASRRCPASPSSSTSSRMLRAPSGSPMSM